MKILKTLRLFCLLACISALCGCDEWCLICEDDDKEMVISAKDLPLTGAQEVPPKETDAYGKADVWYNKHTKMLAFKLKWNDLSGEPVGAHIHGEAPKGMNAPVVYDFFDAFSKSTSGMFIDSFKIQEAGINEDSLLNGFYYFNIHTPENPGGEIRGQIEFD